MILVRYKFSCTNSGTIFLCTELCTNNSPETFWSLPVLELRIHGNFAGAVAPCADYASRASEQGAMDDSITAPLHDIFMAYSLPWGVLKDQGAATRTSPLRPGLSPRKGSGIQGIVTNVADAMDAIGWQRLCADCKLDEDTSLPPARPVFQQIAQGNSLEFDGFVKVLQAVARARYGDHDDMARLVYFKVSVLRDGRARSALTVSLLSACSSSARPRPLCKIAS
jgi:hypothetical protein